MTLLEIIFKIQPGLAASPNIHAMWIEGSYATGSFRKDSDIDIWLDAEGDKFQEVVDLFQECLSELHILRAAEHTGLYSEDPQLLKSKFYLKDKTDDQRIELDIQSHKRKFKFLRIENQIIILFDKDQTIQWQS